VYVRDDSAGAPAIPLTRFPIMAAARFDRALHEVR
jgi:hypothetical protein